MLGPGVCLGQVCALAVCSSRLGGVYLGLVRLGWFSLGWVCLGCVFFWLAGWVCFGGLRGPPGQNNMTLQRKREPPWLREKPPRKDPNSRILGFPPPLDRWVYVGWVSVVCPWCVCGVGVWAGCGVCGLVWCAWAVCVWRGERVGCVWPRCLQAGRAWVGVCVSCMWPVHKLDPHGISLTFVHGTAQSCTTHPTPPRGEGRDPNPQSHPHWGRERVEAPYNSLSSLCLPPFQHDLCEPGGRANSSHIMTTKPFSCLFTRQRIHQVMHASTQAGSFRHRRNDKTGNSARGEL